MNVKFLRLIFTGKYKKQSIIDVLRTYARAELHSHGSFYSKINIEQNSTWIETAERSSSGAILRKYENQACERCRKNLRSV